MSTGIIITLIICGTLIILSIINVVKECKQRKESQTIFDKILKGDK